MFSGIIETIGKLVGMVEIEGGLRLALEADLPTEEVGLGESICTNGTCLTVTGIEGGHLTFDVSAESLRRTTLGDLELGDTVNLERSLRLQDRLSGHVVSGHVDGVGTIKSITEEGESFLYTFSLQKSLALYLVEKGSVAVDGISLTVFNCEATQFSCSIIPHTHTATTLHTKKEGDRVNIESDMQAKYIQKFVEESLTPSLSREVNALKTQISAMQEELNKRA